MNRGYTVVEVMMSLALLGVGAAGVIALQKATLLGNTNARNVATANAIAQTWVERIRSEALQWNAPNNTDDILTDTNRLQGYVTNPQVTSWFNPAQILPVSNALYPAGSPAADVLGGDIYPKDPSQPAFCTKIRLTRLFLYPSSSNQSLSTTRTIRVEVRVYWDRAGQPVNCAAATIPDPETGDNTRYGFVSLVTAVTQNPKQG